MNSRPFGIPGVDLRYRLPDVRSHKQRIHLVLRARPDVVTIWSDEDVVARRWLRLFPANGEKDGSAAEPTNAEIATSIGPTPRERSRGFQASSVGEILIDRYKNAQKPAS